MIEGRNVKKYFSTPRGPLHAVDGINLTINEGETLGVVGESGCGKTTLGRVLIRLLEATDGEVLFNGDDILKYTPERMLEMRKMIQIIFQDPYSSLNPRMTVSDIISEPIKVCKILEHKVDIEDRVFELMDIVGLAERFVNVYPHELDGGRRQRIGIARALAVNPKFIVCDEPVSSLDVSIQAQILNLLMDLQEEFRLAFLFITHDLSVVKHISNDIMVMYLGECVEQAPSQVLFETPRHPYTVALLDAIPVPNLSMRGVPRKIIKGEVTSPVNPKPGCRFASRCPNSKAECADPVPYTEVAPGHIVKCILH